MVLAKLRIRLARWILGGHCDCYKMGYHKLCDFKKQGIGKK
jgi:hypothetical protein